MNIIRGTSAAILLGLSAAACGGGAQQTDEAAIADLVDDYLDSFLAGDVEELVGLSSGGCPGIQQQVQEDVEAFQARNIDATFEVTEVDIRSLSETSAEVLPQGVITLEGEARPFFETGGEYTTVTKEQGQWKFADCEFFGVDTPATSD